MNDIADKLLSADSPFRWKPVILPENRFIIDKEIIDDDKFSYLNFIIEIVDIYQKFDDRISEAIEAIEILEKKLNCLRESGKDEIFGQIAVALLHVTYSSKASMFLHSNRYEELPSILSNLTEIEKMDARNQAAMLAIQSSVVGLYSYEGTITAVSQINIALSIDREFALWHFLKGWYLHRIRFWENIDEKPSFDERESFEKAHKVATNNALFMVYLADTIKDHATHSSKRSESYKTYLPDDDTKNSLMKKIEEKYEKSLELYKKSYSLNPDNPHVSFRVAYGLMTLPRKYQDLKLVKTIIIANSPKFPQSGYGNFVIACYYKFYGKNEPLATRHYETSADLNYLKAHFSIIIYKYKESKEQQKEYDAVQNIKNLFTVFKEKPHVSVIISQIASYYVFVDLNLEEACDNVLKLFEMDKYGNSLQYHRSCFLFNANSRNISLIDILTDEVKYRLGNPKIKSKDKQFFERFIEKVNFQNIRVAEGKPQNLRFRVLNQETGKGISNMKKSQPVRNDSNTRNPSSSGKFIEKNANARKPNAKNDNFNQGSSGSQRNGDVNSLNAVKMESTFNRQFNGKNANARKPNAKDDNFNRGPSGSQRNNDVNSLNAVKVESTCDRQNTKLRQLRQIPNSSESTKIDSISPQSRKIDRITDILDSGKMHEQSATATHNKYDRKDRMKTTDQSLFKEMKNRQKDDRSLSPKIVEDAENKKLRNVVDCERPHSRETVRSSKINSSHRRENVSSEVIADLANSLQKQNLRDVQHDEKHNRERSNSRDTVRSSRKYRERSNSRDTIRSSRKYRERSNSRDTVKSSRKYRERSNSRDTVKSSRKYRERSNSRDTVRSSRVKKSHRRDRSLSDDSYSDDEQYRRHGRKTRRHKRDSSSSRSRSLSRVRKSKKKHSSRDRKERRKRSRSSSKKRRHGRHHSRSRKRSTSDGSDGQRSHESHSVRNYRVSRGFSVEASKSDSLSENEVRSHRKHNRRSSRERSVRNDSKDRRRMKKSERRHKYDRSENRDDVISN